MDYGEISDRQLIFSSVVSNLAVRVDIIDDNVLEELVERFTAVLSSVVPRLALLPEVANIDITDNDGQFR